MINGREEILEGEEVQVALIDVQGNRTYPVNALTESVSRKMEVIDWKAEKSDWSRIAHIEFPTLAKQQCVEKLIGSDYPELHR